MNLLQAIVELLTRSRLYLMYPNLPTSILELLREYPDEVPNRILLSRISQITGEEIGYLPEYPKNGLVICQTDGQYSVVSCSSDSLNQSADRIIGRHGPEQSFPILTRDDLVVTAMKKVSESRLYLTSLDQHPSTGTYSIVFDSVRDQTISRLPKDINLTFFDCSNLTISELEVPIGGLKLYRCSNLTIYLTSQCTSSVILLYLFYSSQCKIYVPRFLSSRIIGEVVECLYVEILTYD